MEPKTVVALEIASSKIKGAVGSIESDGRLTVLAVEETPAINNVRYGRVQNIREVSDALADIIGRLEASRNVTPAKISGAIVAVGGRSVMGAPTTASLRFQRECEITDSLVQRLIFEATRDYVGERSIIDTLPRMFYVNNTAVKKAVGNFAETLRGDFTMVTCGKETRQNLERLKFGKIEPDHIHYRLRATAIADFVLSSDEKQVGCMLVDFGAGTCTVSVYREGALCFLSTIPMGSRLITLDIMAGLGVTEEAAENFKTTLATLGDKHGTGVNAVEIDGYVRARAGEIAANILNQLTVSGMADNISKIVLTGGGAKLPEFATVLSNQAKLPVRVADMSGDVVFRTPGRNNSDNIDIVALLWAARTFPAEECLSLPSTGENENIITSGTTTAEKTVAGAVAAAAVAETVREVEVTDAEESLFEETHEDMPEDYDEEDILSDDPDDPEDDESQEPRRRFGLFSRTKAKKTPKRPVREPEPEPEPEEDVYEEEDEPEEIESEPEISKISRTLEGMKAGIIKFFTTPEEDDDDEDN